MTGRDTGGPEDDVPLRPPDSGLTPPPERGLHVALRGDTVGPGAYPPLSSTEPSRVWPPRGPEGRYRGARRVPATLQRRVRCQSSLLRGDSHAHSLPPLPAVEARPR